MYKIKLKKISPAGGAIKTTRGKVWGFTLIEIIFVVIILVILSTLSLVTFNRYKERQAIDVNSQIVAEALREARDETLDSLDASTYGIHFASSTVIIFKGSTYNAMDPDNEERVLLPPVIVSNTTISGSDVVFERLTGETSNPGSIFISVAGKSTPAKEIIIEPTGLVYVRE